MSGDPALLVIAHVALAALLGGVIGLEREWKGKPAGIRTHMLVAAAAALLVSLGPAVAHHFHDRAPGGEIRSDPVGILAAMITGISFVCAGIIFRRGDERVEGLTTAASMLIVAGIGASVAAGRLPLACLVTLLVLVILLAVGRMERWLERARGRRRGDPPAAPRE